VMRETLLANPLCGRLVIQLIEPPGRVHVIGGMPGADAIGRLSEPRVRFCYTLSRSRRERRSGKPYHQRHLTRQEATLDLA
jgi:hypothetical protein